MSNIQDPDVNSALETLKDEFFNLEETVRDQNSELDELDDKNKSLKQTIEELEQEVDSLQEQVKSLEEALAEAYLTDEAHNGTTEESNNKLQCGRSADVSNTADDKASN